MSHGPHPRIAAHLDRVTQLPAEERLRIEAELVAPYVDAAFYASVHGRGIPGSESPARHFCRTGWRHLLKPSREFDVWWYWANYLDPSSSELNPLVHYALVGVEEGLLTRPLPQATRATATTGARLPEPAAVRRACLFAAFDQDGIVDEATVRLIAELSRHGDVFVLYDNYLPPSELRKLDGIATGAWAVRHGGYDFGSYSMLARDLVGWSTLETYDEVLFVNDSCFLVRELDDVFATMNDRDCGWWGLQATKGLASTREQPSNRFTEPVALDRVRARLDDFEDDAVYDFHLGSYFLAFRRPVIADERFRALVDSVAPEPSKLLVILRYEIGLTHLLLGRGHRFDAYVPTLYPFHPLFTDRHFALLRDGFPLLKRYLIYQNHYDVPGMRRWKERVLEVAPDAPVDAFERLLERTAPDDRLRRSYAIKRLKDGTVRVPRVVRGNAYRRRDEKRAKQADLWVFAVDPATHTLPTSSRAILEAVRDRDDLRTVVLTRSKRLQVPDLGARVEVEPLLSPAGRTALLDAGRVFVPGEPTSALSAPVSAERQTIVAVRHGLHFERTGHATAAPARRVPDDVARGTQTTVPHPEPERTLSGLVAASDVDALAALACTWPARYADVWRTGIPAHDFLFRAEEELPADLRSDASRLRQDLGGRRLVVLMPTLRRSGTERAPYRFTDPERAWLRQWCERHDAILGIREPEGDLERPYSAQLGEQAIDLSVRRYPSAVSVLRAADAVVTDYADTALDYAVTGRPVVGFMHDLDVARDRLLYDPEHFFPGRIAADFEALTAALERVFDDDSCAAAVRGLLVDRRDAESTARLLDHLATMDGGAL